LGDFAFATVEKGTFVIKKRGFGQIPLRPGQRDPRDMLRQYQKEQAERETGATK
jgi:hypothetical protein